MSDAEQSTYLVPLVGAAVDLAAPDQVLQAYEDVGQALRVLSEAKAQLARVLVDHSMQTGRRTVTVPGGQQYERTGGPRTEYVRCQELKAKLLAAGMPQGRVEEIVVSTVDWKVNGTQANAAARANPAYEAILAEHRVTTEHPFRITPK